MRNLAWSDLNPTPFFQSLDAEDQHQLRIRWRALRTEDAGSEEGIRVPLLG